MNRTLLAFTLFLTACGSNAAQTPGPQAATAAPSDPDQECHEETPIGSSISRQVCRSKIRREEDRKSGQELLSQPHQVTN